MVAAFEARARQLYTPVAASGGDARLVERPAIG